MGRTADKTGTDDYSVARLDKDRFSDLAHLHKIVYGTIPGNDHFQTKYDTSYTGIENIGFLAYDLAGKPVAFYGVIPCFIQCGDQIVLAAQSADTMTHTDHRNKGLFMKLAALTFDLCKEVGIKIVFGFPNQNSHRGLVKLGWVTTEVMRRFRIAANGLPLESFSRKFSWTGTFYSSYIENVLRKHFFSRQGLANSVIATGCGGIFRDEKYLLYKTYSPSQVIHLGPCKIWYKIQNGFVIGDMEAVTVHNFETTIEELKKICRRLGVKEIIFQASPDTPLTNLFARNVPAVESFPVMFLDLGSNLDLSQIKFTFADIDIF